MAPRLSFIRLATGIDRGAEDRLHGDRDAQDRIEVAAVAAPVVLADR